MTTDHICIWKSLINQTRPKRIDSGRMWYDLDSQYIARVS